MGILPLRCLTTDPAATTLYGLSYAYKSTDTTMPTLLRSQHMVPFKSQPNPYSLRNISWSVVSTFPGSAYRSDMTDRWATGFTCAVNSAGLFSAFANYKDGEYSSAESPLEGLRYDPVGQMGPEYNVTGGGKWSSINVEKNYNRTATTLYKDQKLFYVGDGKGQEILMHAYIDPLSDHVRIGRVNETAVGNPTLVYSTSYQSDELETAVRSTIAYGNNQLFIYSAGAKPSMKSIPFKNGTLGSSADIRTFEANVTTSCRYLPQVFSVTGMVPTFCSVTSQNPTLALT
ncbi:hypothetical protein BGX23_011748 [Mortierella sp. AD031]|nr:hypothetical protein BGX23_011748 [Mortierella sp. AD031]